MNRDNLTDSAPAPAPTDGRAPINGDTLPESKVYIAIIKECLRVAATVLLIVGLLFAVPV